jgi:Fe2+ or Zn2+ uptake regulation protein
MPLDRGLPVYYYDYMRMRSIHKDVNKIQGRPQTRQRQLLLDIIRETSGHLDARDLFRLAAKKDSFISLATVYRALNLFRQLGLIEEKRLGQARCYYELKKAPQHQHLVCSECGKVIDFVCPLSEIIEKVKAELAFTVTKAEVYMEGYCADCAQKREQKENALKEK